MIPLSRVRRLRNPVLSRAVTYPPLYCSQRPLPHGTSQPMGGQEVCKPRRESVSFNLMWVTIPAYHAPRRISFYFFPDCSSAGLMS